MGRLKGEWKTVGGEQFYLVIKDHWLFRQVLIRDGRMEYSDDTLECSTVFKPRGMRLEKQIMKTIDSYVSDKLSKEEQVEGAVEKMQEVYGDDW